MKKIILILLLATVTAGTAFGEINWFYSYLGAKNAARHQNKNIYVLITAPSWCGWCQKLEDQVLNDENFQDYISENYIALYLEDEINGERNLQLDDFEFEGYPTAMVYAPTGKIISSSVYSDGGLDSDKTIEILQETEDYGLYRENAAQAYVNGDDWLRNNGDGTWSDSEGNLFWTLFADSGWLYVYNEQHIDLLLALPYRSDRSVEMTSFSDWLSEKEDWSVIEGLKAQN